jgi:hypothetical protein
VRKLCFKPFFRVLASPSLTGHFWGLWIGLSTPVKGLFHPLWVRGSRSSAEDSQRETDKAQNLDDMNSGLLAVIKQIEDGIYFYLDYCNINILRPMMGPIHLFSV